MVCDVYFSIYKFYNFIKGVQIFTAFNRNDVSFFKQVNKLSMEKELSQFFLHKLFKA